MGFFDWFKRGKVEKQAAQPAERPDARREYITDALFCAQFLEELRRFFALPGIGVNTAPPSAEQPCVRRDAIPLLMLPLEAAVQPDYNAYLVANTDKMWENLKIDGSLEAMADQAHQFLPHGGEITLYLTNDCTAFDESYQDTFGILVEFRAPSGS